MELADLLQWPILVGAVVIFFAGYIFGTNRARSQRDLIGPPPMRKGPEPPPPAANASPQRLNRKLVDWADLDQQVEAEINAALAGGHKIEAIKILREATGMGLKESKEMVDRRG